MTHNIKIINYIYIIITNNMIKIKLIKYVDNSISLTINYKECIF